ncbi:transporter substrate-binding domain-containing protein [Catenovulum sp. SM1970]|uniref:substrate-binding periplasmic protein n=1 Tax=Marinifaba aquimaris TaxID=2741323 RepID=UPI0015733C58|nr:transporter substrate-binding domain-containing protein [Marinifaba aquimaris]NTS78018.1 transporter substrate-binding domain-containing protein [Marinifaba aquimaris]
MKSVITLANLAIAIFFTYSVSAKTMSVATNQWQPYINSQSAPLGSAAELLTQIVSQDDHEISWRYQNYDLAFNQVALGKQTLAFPYFKTEQRAASVLYSDAIFTVTNHIYYNRQQASKLNFNALDKHTFGRVAGYSYGEKIDGFTKSAVIFANENDALAALLQNEIDFLPMTKSVMNTMLNQQYKDQALLIKHVEQIAEQDSMHLIAAKTDEGKQAIAQVNRLIAQVADIASLKLKQVERERPKDIAKLITAEGYPAIVGQTSLSANTQYFTLPQGTRVLVLNWSDKILKASESDRLYKSMIDLSQVVILNGPHVGKELYIRNMHLEIQ